jgi:EAL domain-containing protein (putative c-di-GMP-specific phosphodiesterase class I)
MVPRATVDGRASPRHALELDGRAALDDAISYADAVHRLLAVVRTQLGMAVAWVSEFVGGDQVLRYVDAAEGADAPAEGARTPLGATFCARVLDGRFPSLVPDVRAVPEAALLDVAHELHIGAYVGIPLIGPHGVPVGMLCAVDGAARPDLSQRDEDALRLLADLLRDLQRSARHDAAEVRSREVLQQAVRAVVAGTGRHAVLQPIVDLVSGRAVAAEGLTRFTARSPAEHPGDGSRSPAQWFDDASHLGLREQLELASARAVLDLLDSVVPDGVAVSVNLSPQTLVGAGLAPLLDGRSLERIVLEVTEHAPVADYAALAAALDRYRARGLRLAVDDAGAGYSSFQHVLAVRPDLIKIDMVLVRGADRDLARRTLLTALADFAEATECRLVAEGVETDGELRAVAGCGVHLAQGHHLERPSRRPTWSGYPLP